MPFIVEGITIGMKLLNSNLFIDWQTKNKKQNTLVEVRI